jgi:hypothetical protein
MNNVDCTPYYVKGTFNTLMLRLVRDVKQWLNTTIDAGIRFLVARDALMVATSAMPSR